MKSHTVESYPKLGDRVKVVNTTEMKYGQIGTVIKHDKVNDDGTRLR